ncbi:MAG: hypothetical protein LBM69_03995 [Lachnospiraceae bacterium]|jgi:hypothetical protein|nr:hypothetical protein [Lachnospiraceae bacterium]
MQQRTNLCLKVRKLSNALIGTRKKSYIGTLCVFLVLIYGLFIANLWIESPALSLSERRVLQKMPKLEPDEILSGTFSEEFEEYTADHFVLRDTFRTLRSAVIYGLYRQTDKDGIYYHKGDAGKFEQLKDETIVEFATHIQALSTIFQEANQYYAAIPDKSIYADRDYPGYDPDETKQVLAKQLPHMTAIDFVNTLQKESFYQTDLHWNQPLLWDVTEALGAAMGFRGSVAEDFTAKEIGSFHGVYAGQAALPMPKEPMIYMEPNDPVNVYFYTPSTEPTDVAESEFSQTDWTLGTMYELEDFEGYDPYDIFLGGITPLICLENERVTPQRDLWLFRDSFGSSLAPLLTGVYSRIYLVDLRYIGSAKIAELYQERISAAQTPLTDVLYLYSTQVIGNPSILLE